MRARDDRASAARAPLEGGGGDDDDDEGGRGQRQGRGRAAVAYAKRASVSASGFRVLLYLGGCATCAIMRLRACANRPIR